jgi:peptidoglycan/xylan/chitin deacetylase (PgdA/CDA1 family)
MSTGRWLRTAGIARAPALLAVSLVALLGATLFLPSQTPAQACWEVVETQDCPTLRPATPSPGCSPLPTPSPTPIDLPVQARVPILMYHYVSELPADADIYRRDLTVSPEGFREQLQYIADAGYHAVSLVDIHLYLTRGIPLPHKPVVLSFDDGYIDAYEVVFPLLLEYGFTGTFFVLATPAHLASPAYLTWDQMKEMSDAGMDIQGHGRDHIDLTYESYDSLVYQILGVREAVEAHTGRAPLYFCYPSGRYNDDVIAVVEGAGYWGAVTTEWGRTHTLDGAYVMPRIRMRSSDTLADFVDKLEG